MWRENFTQMSPNNAKNTFIFFIVEILGVNNNNNNNTSFCFLMAFVLE
jgi:hypothetical protein